MRFGQLLIPTIREDPADAEVASHRLMIRAGMIRQVAAGIYSLLPLGLRVVRKVETIIREEMNRAGAQEVFLPTVQPAELWQESGRWQIYGKELLRFQDRKGRDFCLGPTHEEVITDLVRGDVRSWRNLPINLYQIQTKFRDEARPRFGLMRGREFSMKDAYSFDADDDGARVTYGKMFEAYTRIFSRCGLDFRAVEADTGAIGGSDSHEFMVLANSGEDEIASCDHCDYAANVERVEVAEAGVGGSDTPDGSPERVETPGQRTVEEVSAFLGLEPAGILKTLLLLADGEPVLAVLRGDRELNALALKRLLAVDQLELADDAQVREFTGAPVGFAGPVGLDLPIYADQELRGGGGFACGANQADAHLKGVVPGRDFEPTSWAQLRRAVPGDRCARCEDGTLGFRRGIEVGHIFRLGTKYSEAMGASFLDPQGKARPLVMGCYGIGVGRTAAAAIEQNHDDRGLVWPVPLAPFEVIVIALKGDEPEAEAARIHDELEAAGIEVLLDDRSERPGVKFKDAELIGFPFAVVVGARGLEEGVAELKVRADGSADKVPLSEVVERVRAAVKAAMGAEA